MKKAILMLSSAMFLLSSCGTSFESTTGTGNLTSPSTNSQPNSSLSSSTEDVFKGNSKENPFYENNDENIQIYFLEMNRLYEDSIFIKKGNIDILIDAGWDDEGDNINRFLKEHVTDNKLDVVIASHPHGDHVGGMEKALNGFNNVDFILDYGNAGSEGTYGSIRQKLIKNGSKHCGASDSIGKKNACNDTYYFTENFYVNIFDTGYYDVGDPNTSSLATMFNYKDFNFYTSGDLTSKAELQMLSNLKQKNISIKNTTIYKANHHGSKGSNTSDLLTFLNPTNIAISAARAGSYMLPVDPKSKSNLLGNEGHPHAEAIKRFYECKQIKENKNVYWNAVNGTMLFESDGTNSVTFSGSETKRGYYTDVTNLIWNEELGRYDGKVEGEENLRLSESKMWKNRNYGSLIS